MSTVVITYLTIHKTGQTVQKFESLIKKFKVKREILVLGKPKSKDQYSVVHRLSLNFFLGFGQ